MFKKARLAVSAYKVFAQAETARLSFFYCTVFLWVLQGGLQAEVIHAALEQGLVLIAGHILVNIAASALAVAHLAQNASIGAGNALDRQHAAVGVIGQVHGSLAVLVHILGSNLSPWLSKCNPGDEHMVAISHGEGRFVAPEAVLQSMIANGQIATQYVNLNGQATMDLTYNPNGSVLAIEGITSPDGRVLGKMGHSERSGRDLYKNVQGNKYQPLFEGGVDYFRL